MQFEKETGNFIWKLSSYSLSTFSHTTCYYYYYLAEMQVSHETVPEIYEEFKQGNWVENNHSVCHSVQLVQIMPWSMSTGH